MGQTSLGSGPAGSLISDLDLASHTVSLNLLLLLSGE